MKLFVRIQKKTGAERFFRAGILFTKIWQEIEVDDATALRLHEEQMLEVTDSEPDGYEAPTAPADTIDPASVPAPEKAPAESDTADSVSVTASEGQEETAPAESDATDPAAVAKPAKAQPKKAK